MKYISETYPIEVVADEGYCFTNGEIYSTHLVLGIYDNIENWQEIPMPEDMAEVPEDAELS